MISSEQVKKAAKLSKLTFKNDEIINLQKDLSGILDMFTSLEELNVDNVEPLKSVLNINLHMRKDEALKQNLQSELFQNAPKKSNNISNDFNYFIVPKVVE
jgi:aspartyl-tRNA(Asn)/glutamyl-tRNA(Gln) amidotransferase subunit C